MDPGLMLPHFIHTYTSWVTVSVLLQGKDRVTRWKVHSFLIQRSSLRNVTLTMVLFA